MKLKVQITFLNCHVGGSLVKKMEFTKVPGPEDLKEMFCTFQPPHWKVHKVDVVEIVNDEEVKNPVTFHTGRLMHATRPLLPHCPSSPSTLPAYSFQYTLPVYTFHTGASAPTRSTRGF